MCFQAVAVELLTRQGDVLPQANALWEALAILHKLTSCKIDLIPAEECLDNDFVLVSEAIKSVSLLTSLR